MDTTERRLTGSGTRDVPMEVGDEDDMPSVREESQDNTDIALADIPAAGDGPSDIVPRSPRPDEGGSLFLSDESASETETGQSRRNRGIKEESTHPAPAEGEDDKKKLALNTTYDGFSIYGRILCLVVKRKGMARGKELAGGAGQAMMEDWISSTQAAEGQIMDD